MTGKFGPFDLWVTILHSDANTAVFILQDIIPAYFSPGDVDREIQRLSQRFGQAARVLNGDARADAPHSVIAAWGDVTLTPLDESTVDELRRGENHHRWPCHRFPRRFPEVRPRRSAGVPYGGRRRIHLGRQVR